MNRIVRHIPIGDSRIRTTVRLEGEDCSPQTPQALLLQRVLFQTLADNFDLLNCGLEPFQTLRVFHDGQRWIVEVEAVYEKG
jgi:hypothetical protein